MKRRPLAVGLIALALFVLTAGSALAKGQAAMIRIAGPGLAGFQTFTDAETTETLSIGQLEAFNRPLAEPPETVGPGYAITRYLEPGSYVPWDQVVYYPNPAGGRGAVFYVGIFNGWSAYDGRWFEAQPESERYLLDLLAAEGVSAQPAPAAQGSLPYTAIGIGAAALLGLGGIVIVARRRAVATSQPAA